MRRTDREITERQEILEILRKCDCCRLGLCQGSMPYVVPVNFGIAQEDGRLVLYIHGANAGKKLELLRVNPNVCIEADTSRRLVTGENACSYTMEYESVIAYGRAEILTGAQAVIPGLNAIMAHYQPEISHWEYNPAYLNAIAIVRIPVDNITGKRLRR